VDFPDAYFIQKARHCPEVRSLEKTLWILTRVKKKKKSNRVNVNARQSRCGAKTCDDENCAEFNRAGPNKVWGAEGMWIRGLR
jgi:hypothetical protein